MFLLEFIIHESEGWAKSNRDAQGRNNASSQLLLRSSVTSSHRKFTLIAAASKMKKKTKDLLIEMVDQTFTSKFCDTNRLYICPSWFEPFQTPAEAMDLIFRVAQ